MSSISSRTRGRRQAEENNSNNQHLERDEQNSNNQHLKRIRKVRDVQDQDDEFLAAWRKCVSQDYEKEQEEDELERILSEEQDSDDELREFIVEDDDHNNNFREDDQEDELQKILNEEDENGIPEDLRDFIVEDDGHFDNRNSNQNEENESENEDTDDLEGFIVNDSQVSVRNVTLRQIIDEEAENDGTFRRRETGKVPAPDDIMPFFRIPGYLFEVDNRFGKYMETDQVLIEKFAEFVKTPRNDWNKNPYYVKLYCTVIQPALEMGRITKGGFLAYKLVSSGALSYLENIPPESDSCDGCGIRGRIPSMTFQALDKQQNPIRYYELGSYCGRKMECVIELFKVLNSVQFIPLEDQVVARTHAAINAIIAKIDDAFIHPWSEEHEIEDVEEC